MNGAVWTGIATFPAAGNSTVEKTYSFTDNNTSPQIFYRLAQYDIDGRVYYSGILKASCTTSNDFNVWPNPVADKLFVSITADQSSKATISLFDGKGALVKKQEIFILRGINQLAVEIDNLAKGIYRMNVVWNNGVMKKNTSVIKQ